MDEDILRKIRIILSKDPTLRTPYETDYLIEYLFKIKFFQDNKRLTNDETFIKKLLNSIQFQEFPKNKVLSKQGMIGNTFVIVIYGRLEKYKTNVDINDQTNRTVTHIEYINSGDIHGEEYLETHSHIKQKYSIKCLNNCGLWLLTRKDFRQIFVDNTLEEKIKAVSMASLFNSFKASNQTLINLVNSFEEKTYNLNEVAVKQGDPIEYLYLIKEGAFEVHYQITKHVSSTLGINFFAMINDWALERFSERRVCEIKGDYGLKYSSRLLILEAGQLFGDLEIYNKNKQSYFSIVCSHHMSTVFRIPVKNLRISFVKEIRQKQKLFKTTFLNSKKNDKHEEISKFDLRIKKSIYQEPKPKLNILEIKKLDIIRSVDVNQNMKNMKNNYFSNDYDEYHYEDENDINDGNDGNKSIKSPGSVLNRSVNLMNSNKNTFSKLSMSQIAYINAKKILSKDKENPENIDIINPDNIHNLLPRQNEIKYKPLEDITITNYYQESNRGSKVKLGIDLVSPLSSISNNNLLNNISSTKNTRIFSSKARPITSIESENNENNHLTSTKNTRIFSSKLREVNSLESEMIQNFKRDSINGSLIKKLKPTIYIAPIKKVRVKSTKTITKLFDNPKKKCVIIVDEESKTKLNNYFKNKNRFFMRTELLAFSPKDNLKCQMKENNKMLNKYNI